MEFPMSERSIRAATFDDWPIIAEFNQHLALESEGKRLNPEHLREGVQALLRDSHKGRYFMACLGQEVIGQLMHTWEWSDWRNGQIWWIQSVYVHPDHRRQGVFRQLYDHLSTLARTDEQVVGLRLYVESENELAHATYRNMGMDPGGYFVMERFFRNQPDA